MSLCLTPTLQAREFGEHPERAEKRLVVTPGKKLNVRSKPSTSASLLNQLRPGDVVYVDSIHFIYREGYEWLPIRAKWGKGLSREAYVTNFNRFRIEANPLYNPPPADIRKIEEAVQSSQTVAKWVLLILSVGFAAILLWKYFSKDGKEKLIGYPVNGMRRTFFLNPQPYIAILYLTAVLIGGITAAMALMLLIAGAVSVALWIIKLICNILVWISIVVCIWSFFMVLGGKLKALPGIIGGFLIWWWRDEIRQFGEKCADTGLMFFNEFNVAEFTRDLALTYWKDILMCAVVPLAIFLSLAVLWLLTAGILIGVEKIMTRRYSVKHPCPHCHHPSEPARYLSKDEDGYWPLPNGISLRPGLYGLLHITHPITKEKMPTMLLNGRDHLVRECANCGMRIQADEGTERHLVLIGTPQSGKSVLTYRLIAEIFRRAGEGKVDFTDVNNTIRDKGIFRKVESIMEKEQVAEEDLPAKTAVADTASTQLVIRRNHAPLPYRLFINDVGGELYNIESNAQQHPRTRFFHNADSLLFLIDPVTTDFSDCDISGTFREWLGKNAPDTVVKLKMRDLQETVDNLISIHGNHPKRIHLNIVLPKIDLGYLPEWVNHNSEETLRRFISEEMGLDDLLHWAGKFSGVSLFSVGAMGKREKANITPIIDKVIVGQLDIRI